MTTAVCVQPNPTFNEFIYKINYNINKIHTQLNLIYVFIYMYSLLVFDWWLFPHGWQHSKNIRECCIAASFRASHRKIHQLWATRNITLLLSGFTYGFNDDSLSLPLHPHSHHIYSPVFCSSHLLSGLSLVTLSFLFI